MAEGGGLLNRYTGSFPYRGFESLLLRQNIFCNRSLGGLLCLLRGSLSHGFVRNLYTRQPEGTPKKHPPERLFSLNLHT